MVKNKILLYKAIIITILLLYYSLTASASMSSVKEKLSSVICGFYKVFFSIAGAIASLVFVIAGVKWIASENDPGARKQAKEIMVQALVGLIIVISTKAIIDAVIAGTGAETCPNP